MTMEFGQEDFRIFLEEGQAHLETLEQSLLVLEDSIGGALDLGMINEMFRAAHSVKGAAGMLGLKAIQSVTHQLENLLGRMREGVLAADVEIVEALFEAVDVLRTLMVEMSGPDRTTRTDIKPTVERLKRLLEAREASASSIGVDTSLLPFSVDPALEASLDARAMEAAKRAVREKRYVYQARVVFEGCKFVDGNLDHPVIEKLLAITELIALHSDPALPSPETTETFSIDGYALLQSSADLTIIQMLVPLDASLIQMVYDPANPPAAPAGEPAAAPKLVQQEVVPVVRKAEEADVPAEAPGEGAEGGQKAAGKVPGAAAKATSQSIRVDVERLDDLVNVVGEIVIGNTRLSQLGQALGIRYDRDTTVQNLNEALGQLARLVGDLQMTVMRTRMIPVERVFNRFPRLVRDLSRMLGKEVKLELYGQETEIDKTVSEELEDPLVHLMRNAVDHGVERPDVREGAGKSRIGTVKMSAHHEGSYIVIVLEDDGGGIDPQKVLKKAREQGLAQPDYNYSENEILQFIFAPGFSTAEKITDVSGRGVGMDVVNQNIRKIKGSITVQSAKGIGTKFIIKLPLTLAITKALLVRSGGETYAIPLDAVRESIRLSQSEIKTINGRPVTQNRAEVLPLYNLSDAFGFTNHDESLNGGYMPVVVVGGEKHQLGLIVDRLEGEQDVVVKSMGSYLKDIRGVAGATILGDGRVALILDIATLIDESGLDDRSFDRQQAGQRA